MTFPVFSASDTDPTIPIYPAQRSLRFRAIASARLARTFGTPTSQNIYTWSAWVKRGTLGSVQRLFGASTAHSFGFTATDTLSVITGSTIATTGVWKDPAAWYHVVYSQNGTAVSIYVNNVLQGSGTATNSSFNTAISHLIGAVNTTTPTSFFDGLIALNYFVDGQALTPSAFGANNLGTSVWSPKAYTGTFGNNGYFLQFLDNSSNTSTTIGLDTSGRGNNWTPTNISVTAGVTYDSFTDVPTNTSFSAANFAAINSLSLVTTAVPSSANMQTTSVAAQALLGSIRMDSGKFYWEVQFSAATAAQLVGVYKTSATTVTVTPTTNVIGVRFDATAGTLDYTTDGSSYTSIATGLTGGGYFPYAASTTNAKIIYVNFGQRPLSYTQPAGYYLLNTYYQMAAPVPSAARAFAVTAYTGNGTTQAISNLRGNGSFYPDLVMIKSRVTAYGMVIYDYVRGVSRQLITTTGAAQTTANGVTAFSSSGFTVGAVAETNANTNTYVAYQWKGAGGSTTWNFDGTLTRTATMTAANPCVVTVGTNGFVAGQAVQFTTTGALPSPLVAGNTYYAGNILSNTTFNLYTNEANAITGGATGRISTAGGTQSGTHTCEHASKVDVNPTNGVSIVTYVGTGVNTTVGHGLNQVPDCVIIKSTGSITDWPVYHKFTGNTQYMFFNKTDQAASSITYWNNTTPTTTVMSLGNNGNLNANGTTYVMYAFVSTPGFSDFGNYTGDGLANGLFQYTGFKPRLWITKRTSSNQSWITFNSAAQSYNTQGQYMFIEATSGEGAAALLDFVSNGFKLRSGNGATNLSTATYAYMTWAENPFKYGIGG